MEHLTAFATRFGEGRNVVHDRLALACLLHTWLAYAARSGKETTGDPNQERS